MTAIGAMYAYFITPLRCSNCTCIRVLPLWFVSAHNNLQMRSQTWKVMSRGADPHVASHFFDVRFADCQLCYSMHT